MAINLVLRPYHELHFPVDIDVWTHLVSTPQWMPHDVDVWTEACQTMELLVQTLQAVMIVPRTDLVRSRVGHRIHHVSAEIILPICEFP